MTQISDTSSDARRTQAREPHPDSPLGRLLSAPMRSGELIWIGVRPARKAPVLSRTSALLRAGHGIDGDHYDTHRDGPRQATLIAAEDIAAISSFLGRETIPPDLLRRNFVTRGINLLALKGRSFRIGTTLLVGTGECAPCSRMEEVLGVGGYNAVRGHGGITVRILQSGTVRIGDAVIVD